MCDCAEELERKRRLAEARAASGQDDDANREPTALEYWGPIIGSSALILGILTVLYRTFDIGTKIRNKINAAWDSIMHTMCDNYAKQYACQQKKLEKCGPGLDKCKLKFPEEPVGDSYSCR